MRPDKHLIFDIGMHTGQDTDFYLKKGYKVVAVEANPALTEQNVDKFAEAIKEHRLKIESKAIASELGRVTFYVNKRVSEWSSTVKHLGERESGAAEITVEAITLHDLCHKYGMPYYLKIDIEGADLIPIRALAEMPVRPALVSYEAASINGAAVLSALNYSQFKLVDQLEVPNMGLPKPALEGRYVDHKFPRGASGPFGMETPGPWGTFEESVTDYIIYKHFRRADKRREQTWADFHARSETLARTFADASDTSLHF